MCLIWVFAGLAKGYALKGEGDSTESLAYRVCAACLARVGD